MTEKFGNMKTFLDIYTMKQEPTKTKDIVRFLLVFLLVWLTATGCVLSAFHFNLKKPDSFYGK